MKTLNSDQVDPFIAKKKLRFQIDINQETQWVDIAIVDADIPMLLGNNILKPLEAEIKLFGKGDAAIKLGEVTLELKETRGGHYTLKVQDLGKLCGIATSSYFAKGDFKCDKCAKVFENSACLVEHKRCSHVNSTLKSTLKNHIQKKETFDKEKNCVHNVINDLNTQLNGKLSKKEKCFVQIMKRMAEIQLEESNLKCDMCERATLSNTNVKIHELCPHGVQLENRCDFCLNELQRDKDMQTHNPESTLESIFLSHHQEEKIEDQDELNSALWETLLVDTDNSMLTQEEELGECSMVSQPIR